MSNKIWQYRVEEGFRPSEELVEAADGSLLVAKLLHARGLDNPSDARDFLDLESYQPTSAWELPDMEAAVGRIQRALKDNETILIFGDFDVDGITGTSILYECFTYLGANVSYYIPDRAAEGHGLNAQALVRLKSTRKFSLLISTDTGITNFNEVNLLNGLGVDTIITDHHELPENLPLSVANVNPMCFEDMSNPMSVLCGAGVAYKLCELLLEAHAEAHPDKKAETEIVCERLLDLTAIGTVADLAKLQKENRYLVYKGLQTMNRRERVGVQAILNEAGTKPEAILTSETVGFTIGPRLNALGRLSNATEAVELLTTNDKAVAAKIAAHLEQLNRERRDLCDSTHLEAESFLQRQGGEAFVKENRCIILGSPGWNLGIIGIVASRLIDKYHVPVFMMKIDEEAGTARCSGRSIRGFHLHDELLKLEHYFDHFGGHAGAGGFSIDLKKLESFKKDLYALTKQQVTDEMMRPIIDVDARLDWKQLTPHLVTLIDKLAPFGMENPAPRFVLENVSISAQRAIGEDGRHLKLVLSQKGQKPHIDGLLWNFGSGNAFDTSQLHNFVVNPDINTFNGETKIQVIIDDYKSPQRAAVTSEVAVHSTDSTMNAKQAVAEPALKRHTPVDGSVSDEPVSTSANKFKASVRWVDHRSRDALDTFVGQLMMPAQKEANVLLYHEGRPPEIPFLEADMLASRHQVKSVDELILWDFPPSNDILQDILNRSNAGVVHLVGGKYIGGEGQRPVPIMQPEDKYLKAVYQVLSGMARTSTDATLNSTINALSATLATTTDTLTSALLVLQHLGLVHLRIEASNFSLLDKPLVIQPVANMSFALPEEAKSWLEYEQYRTHLNEAGEYRRWLLNTDLDTIKARTDTLVSAK